MIRRPAHTVLMLLLALLLGLTSQSLATARGQTRAGEAVVICSGDGFVTIELDAQGNPVGPAHLCPDMVLAFFAAMDLPPVVLPQREGRTERAALPPGQAAASQSAPAANARAPPATV
ncbi:hypothetical protein GVY41_14280 [Frigidibacter albus]|uniref:DUF2946 domain-containing protein n=1 Tax=Frigidibacter albus TaxID=1465486 RepID=A0A6L8VIX6_9RHOB|nr:hypothetical protein [Frigidibacter albus]MZQ90337.1 hypothetical protein [Frigidibacter albus]NBE32165.1 hypothetical protein [Frigidibacter albus]GGH58833.1 hypothetical protein GCM10011341_29550 [Frigidibacter albus]